MRFSKPALNAVSSTGPVPGGGERLRHQIQCRRSGEDDSREQRGLVEDHLLRRERSHRVAEQEQRLARIVGRDALRERDGIRDESIPPRSPEAAERDVRPDRLAVSAMVVGVDDVAGVAQRLRKTVVAKRVLGDSVEDLHDPARLGGCGGPTANGQRELIGG